MKSAPRGQETLSGLVKPTKIVIALRYDYGKVHGKVGEHFFSTCVDKVGIWSS